jgi:hypothetical protein
MRGRVHQQRGGDPATVPLLRARCAPPVPLLSRAARRPAGPGDVLHPPVTGHGQARAQWMQSAPQRPSWTPPGPNHPPPGLPH